MNTMHFESKNMAVRDSLDSQREEVVSIANEETQRLLELIEVSRQTIQVTFQKLTDVIVKAQQELTPEVAKELYLAGNELSNSMSVQKKEQKRLLGELVQHVGIQSHALGMMDHEHQIVAHQSWLEEQKKLNEGRVEQASSGRPIILSLMEKAHRSMIKGNTDVKNRLNGSKK